MSSLSASDAHNPSNSNINSTAPAASSCSSSSLVQLRRLDAGSRTVEGNVSGSRAAALEQKRRQDAENFEAQKRQRLANSQSNVTTLSSSFRTATKASAAEQAFSNQVVGLVTIDEFRMAAAVTATATAPKSAKDDADAQAADPPEETDQERQKREKAEQKALKRKLKEKKKQLSTLSFAGAEEEEETNVDQEDRCLNKKNENNKLKKDPTVDTSFLFDAHRDQAKVKERKRLEQEWMEQQEAMKQEKLEITYSYWDGSGHRRSLVCQKGDSIAAFLQAALNQLGKEFRNLQGLTSDELIYVKEDLMLPHDVTFYDLIATKARGKSGPLFYFDVHDDVRLGPIDTRVEKEESHPGKIVERKWYERNKHIFPASRWQLYDPTLETYGDYKIGGH